MSVVGTDAVRSKVLVGVNAGLKRSIAVPLDSSHHYVKQFYLEKKHHICHFCIL